LFTEKDHRNFNRWPANNTQSHSETILCLPQESKQQLASVLRNPAASADQAIGEKKTFLFPDFVSTAIFSWICRGKTRNCYVFQFHGPCGLPQTSE